MLSNVTRPIKLAPYVGCTLIEHKIVFHFKLINNTLYIFSSIRVDYGDLIYITSVTAYVPDGCGSLMGIQIKTLNFNKEFNH